MSEEEWSKLLNVADARKNGDGVTENQGITEDYCLRRYDGVIHMVTAADGAAKFYKWGKVADDQGNAVVRNESPQDAVDADRRMQAAWKAHRRRVIVPNSQAGFDHKLKAVADSVVAIAQESHPHQ
jgi:hypothetical protein